MIGCCCGGGTTRDWLVREQTCLGPACECLGKLLQLWKKGSFAGAMFPLDTWCIDGSDDWVIDPDGFNGKGSGGLVLALCVAS